jgi:hypothetical protein
MFFGSYDLQDSSGTVSGKVKKMLKLDYYSDLMDSKDSSGGFPEKVHTPVGLFLGVKLDYFSVLYYGIGEISGKVKMLVKSICFHFLRSG